MWNRLRQILRQRNKELPYERGQGAERFGIKRELQLRDIIATSWSNNQGLYLINSGLHSQQEQPRREKTPGMGVRSLGGYKKERFASASESYLTVGESSRIEWRSRKVVLEAEGGRKMYKMSTHLLPRETRY